MSKHNKKPTYINFDHKSYQKKLASKYIINGETGVLSYPYSKKIYKYWKFRTPDIALASAKKLYQLFIKNLSSNKFIQADICRKFLQMGYTRSMRYYYHRSGTKWKKIGNKWIILPKDYDPIKKKSADIFKFYLRNAVNNPKYKLLKQKFIDKN